MAGRWLVDICYTEAIYQPLTHFPTMRYTPTGRYGGFFALIVQLQKSSFYNNIFLFKQDIVQLHLFKHFLRLINVAKSQLNDIARHLFHPTSFLRHKFFGIRDSRRNKHVDTHLAVIRQEQVDALNLLHNKVYAYRLCKAQHLNGHGDRHHSPIHIPKIDSLMKMTGYIILQLSICNRYLHIISFIWQ